VRPLFIDARGRGKRRSASADHWAAIGVPPIQASERRLGRRRQEPRFNQLELEVRSEEQLFDLRNHPRQDFVEDALERNSITSFGIVTNPPWSQWELGPNSISKTGLRATSLACVTPITTIVAGTSPGTAGVFGAAAAHGKLIGLTEQQMVWARVMASCMV
jgi:hypothetical protein